MHRPDLTSIMVGVVTVIVVIGIILHLTIGLVLLLLLLVLGLLGDVMLARSLRSLVVLM